MNQNIKEFLKAFKLIEPPREVNHEYRLYFNEHGEIIKGTIDNFSNTEEPYILVSKDEYENYVNYIIIDNTLIKRKSGKYYSKIVKSNKGWKTVKNHSGLIVEDNEKYKDITYYDRRNC